MSQVSEKVFAEAIRFVSRHEIATCSVLQRYLRIGYGDAHLILAQLSHINRLKPAHPISSVAEIAKKWIGNRAFGSGAVSSVSAGFFDVESGISFSSTDLYCALIGSKEANDVSVFYGVARATGLRRSNAVVTTILDSIGDDMHAWPADGLVLKITSGPTRLFGHEVRHICSALRGHSTQHCVTALAIHYAGQSDDLVLETIASRINLR